MAPGEFRRALLEVAPDQRDTWLDLVLGIEALPEDGAELPRGCVPYLPSSVDVLLRMIDAAAIDERDVFIDVGAGLGRAMFLTHLLTSATAVGIEVQSHLAQSAQVLAAGLRLSRCSLTAGDAHAQTAALAGGTVFFLYCPFSGERLTALLAALEPIASRREIRICTVDLPLPARPWLTRIALPWGDLAVYRSRPLAGH
jgi:hypothetical protein